MYFWDTNLKTHLLKDNIDYKTINYKNNFRQSPTKIKQNKKMVMNNTVIFNTDKNFGSMFVKYPNPIPKKYSIL